VTAELPQPPAPAAAADETAVLPPVTSPGAADETAVLPPVRGESPADGTPAPGESPADRVPPGYFRDERPAAGPDGSDDRTRELPQVDEEGTPRHRPRPDWAEETPLDDLPTLADELLGPHRDDAGYDDGADEGRDGGRGGGRGRGRRR
jgi:dTMP kinase